MMTSVPTYRCGPVPAGVLLFLLAILLAIPGRCEAMDPFQGYAAEVRIQAGRVVDAVAPGREEELAKEVRTLRRKMYSHGILSINSIPEMVFRRASQEGWKNRLAPSFRMIAEVSPFSAQMWAWMVKEDVIRLRIAALVFDLDGLSGAIRRFAPALFGYAAWLVSFVSAGACWFVVWTSIALFLRARPSLEADIPRIVKLPLRGYLPPLAAALVFLLPLVIGMGLVMAACYWMVFSVAYLRRGELMLMTTAILLLAGLLLGGSTLHFLNGMTGESRKEGWLGADGYFPRSWPPDLRKGQVPAGGALPSWLVRYSRARAAMQAGNPAEAEGIWSEIIAEGKDLPEIRNNRGIARARQGRMTDALADFEAALQKRPGDGPALWNAYQSYLQMFNLERARMIQPLAWDRVQRMSPFHFRPAEMEPGEWIASELPVSAVLQGLLQRRGDLFREAGGGDFYRMFFRPLTPSGSLFFLGVVWLSSVAWKVFSLRVWVHTTCRGCGTRTLIVGIREASDFCNMCRARVGWGIRAGEEKDRRIQGIRMHRNYIRASSVLVPGSGGLWSGKEIRTMIYVVLLSLSLGGVSASLGAQGSGDIISELQSIVTRWALLLAGILWLIGAGWGIWSFGRMQRTLGIVGERG